MAPSVRKLLLAAAAALLPLNVLASYPEGPGRLSLKGFASIESTGTIPWDNTYTDASATTSKTMIINWNSTVPGDKVDALDRWIQATMQKRNIGKRDANHRYVSSHKIRHSHYSIVDFEDMPTEFILEIMDRQEAVSIERNTKVSISNVILAQTNAPDGLVRLSNQAIGGSQYIFDSSAGEGITAYVIDTGILVNHTEFSGRATFGANFVNNVDTDENGHGTHCAGTIAGRTFGVAKNANVVGVKVLDKAGVGSYDIIIQGMEWVYQQVTTQDSASRSVVSMSLGGSFSPAINDAVKDLTDAGIVVVVAAGNADVDASKSSPASAPAAITVGAIDTFDDSKAPFSNFGPDVDIFAPGVGVLSSFISTEGSNINTAVLSGTSMACPHVAGLVAYLMTLEGVNGPENVLARLQELAQASGASVMNNAADTTSLIANNGFLA